MPKLEKQPSFSRKWNTFVAWEKGKEELGEEVTPPVLSPGGEPLSVSCPANVSKRGTIMMEEKLEHCVRSLGPGKPRSLYYLNTS